MSGLAALCAAAPAAPAHAAPGGPVSASDGPDARYALATGCYALRSESAGAFVSKSGGGYRASAGAPGEAEPFRMQATALGKYLFYGRAGDFMAGSGNSVQTASRASAAADWEITVADGAFRIALPSAGKVLAVGANNELQLADAGNAAPFAFEQVSGCADFPEVEVNATGEPAKGDAPYAEVRGLLDAHLHLMAYEFIGGSIRCGRPWHPYGVTEALVDCPDHMTGGPGQAVEGFLSYKDPTRQHDPTGWPTFEDWPHWRSLTHEQIYYKWLERAYRGGLRMFVNLLVDNAVLCEVYPLKRNPCDEMATTRLQLERTHELQDYIDAQHGGPGKGWFRIVTNPFEAREVINDGKLAVVIGMETSRLFDCGVYNDVPECSREDIDRYIDEFYSRGVRSLELVNKFDNAFSGVAGDAGDTGLVVNSGNRYETGSFWQFETCTGPGSDKPQHTAGPNDDALISVFQMFAPPGVAPIYPEPPHCNTRGLTDLGEHLLGRMMEKGMIFDPDHMSVLARNQAISVLEAKNYPGIVSSHSWSSEDAIPRIYNLGGVVTPYAGDSTDFVQAWREWGPLARQPYFFGFGYGADTNGFGSQGAPREGAEQNPVSYPFRSFDGTVTLDKQRSGERTYDINTDGVAHYGLYPDWVEDLRRIAGDEIVEDMARGPESYLQMWERSVGVPPVRCHSQRARFNANGLGRMRLRQPHRRVLRHTGQPTSRGARQWTWCVRSRNERVVSVLSKKRGRVGLVGSTAPGHRALRVGTGDSARRLRGRARPFGRGIRVRRGARGTRFVYGVRRGRVTFVAVATRKAAKSRKRLRTYVRLSGLRG